MRMPWRDFAARTLFAGSVIGATLTGAIVVGMRWARAEPGGLTGDALTFAGVLRERAGLMTTLTFAFHRGSAGAAVACTATTQEFPVDANGAFSVAVPLAGCTNHRGLFDGEAVFYDVYLSGAATGTPVVSAVRVTPVPYARFADQAGVNSDCPAGYVRAFDPSGGITDTPGSLERLCHRVRATDNVVYDEVVRVGSGASAFWIDRFEGTIWRDPQGTRGLLDSPTVPYGTDNAPDYPANFPASGQWARPPVPASRERTILRLYALSRNPNVDPTVPSRTGPSRHMTWFQAQAACRASGKRLPTGDEWLEAAVGTDDGGGTSDGLDRRCVTSGTAPLPSGRSGCRSVWGAWDMVGNVAEWTADWFAAPGAITTAITRSTWPDEGFGGDATYNINPLSGARTNSTEGLGLPAAAIRGGGWSYGAYAGIFTLELSESPARSSSAVGFRCVVPR